MSVSPSLVAILRHVRRHRGWHTNESLATALKISRRTAQLRTNELCQHAVLLPTSKGPGRIAHRFRWDARSIVARRFVQRVELIAS